MPVGVLSIGRSETWDSRREKATGWNLAFRHIQEGQKLFLETKERCIVLAVRVW